MQWQAAAIIEWTLLQYGEKRKRVMSFDIADNWPMWAVTWSAPAWWHYTRPVFVSKNKWRIDSATIGNSELFEFAIMWRRRCSLLLSSQSAPLSTEAMLLLLLLLLCIVEVGVSGNSEDFDISPIYKKWQAINRCLHAGCQLPSDKLTNGFRLCARKWHEIKGFNSKITIFNSLNRITNAQIC